MDVRMAAWLRGLIPWWFAAGQAIAFAFLFLDPELDRFAYILAFGTGFLALIFLILVAAHPRSQRSAAELGFESEEDLAAWRDARKGIPPEAVAMGVAGTIVFALDVMAGTPAAFLALACNLLLIPYERLTRRYPADRRPRRAVPPHAQGGGGV